jgi:hypothetical protein
MHGCTKRVAVGGIGEAGRVGPPLDHCLGRRPLDWCELRFRTCDDAMAFRMFSGFIMFDMQFCRRLGVYLNNRAAIPKQSSWMIRPR